jgi:hypothetical protein
MRPGAKKQVHCAEEALHKYRAQAAAILHAEGLHGDRTERERRQTYAYRILRHRETGVRVRVLDTEAPDAPAESRAYALHRYSVECQTHDMVGDSFVSAKSALAAARRSDEWCSVCMNLMSAPPKARARMRASAAHFRRSDQPLS